jgi:hypothetical protein
MTVAEEAGAADGALQRPTTSPIPAANSASAATIIAVMGIAAGDAARGRGSGSCMAMTTV